MPKKLADEIVQAAIDGFTARKAHFDQQIAGLRAMLNGGSPEAATSVPAPRRKRTMSAAARRKIAMAQRARWAKVRGESERAV